MLAIYANEPRCLDFFYSKEIPTPADTASRWTISRLTPEPFRYLWPVSRMLKWSDTAELGIYQPSQLSSTNMGLHVNDLLYMHLKCWMKKPVKTYTNPTLQLQPLLQIPTKQVLIGSASINVAAEALPPSLDQLPAIITSHLPGPC